MDTDVNESHTFCRQLEDEACRTLLHILPSHSDFLKEQIFNIFCHPLGDYRRVKDVMNQYMDQGLNTDTHAHLDIPMFPSYVRALPSGTEKGKYLALDLGGTNFRVLLVDIHGSEEKTEIERMVIPDHILTCTGIEMALDKAILVEWAKGFLCDGVVGEEVVGMLQAAIDRQKDLNVVCNSLINDAVGTLMTGAQKDPRCTMGMILGTGFNVAYMEKLENVGKWKGDFDDPKQVIISAEWYNLGRDGCLDFFLSDVDFRSDDGVLCEKGQSVIEKMISGMFLGDIVRLTMLKLRENDVVFTNNWSDRLSVTGEFPTKFISDCLRDTSTDFTNTRRVFLELGFPDINHVECVTLRCLCQLASSRAAFLCAVSIACLINRMEQTEIAIASDGSMFEHHPLIQELLLSALPLFVRPNVKYWFVPVKDGSGIGAAIVAAVADNQHVS